MTIYTTPVDVMMLVPSINSLTNVNSEMVTFHIDRVEAVMNAKLAARYTVPLSNNYPVLKYIATDLTVYEILGKRAMTGTVKEGDNDWPSRFKSANGLLDGIISGDIPLVTNSGDTLSARSDSLPWSNTYTYNPTFNEDDYVVSAVDEDKIDDLESQ